LWNVTGEEDANLGIRKRKFGWIQKYQSTPFTGTLKEAGREDDQNIVGENRLSKKRGEAEMMFLSADGQKWDGIITED
jgi:hypothetical protein